MHVTRLSIHRMNQMNEVCGRRRDGVPSRGFVSNLAAHKRAAMHHISFIHYTCCGGMVWYGKAAADRLPS
jgi:hypothetical protein